MTKVGMTILHNQSSTFNSNCILCNNKNIVSKEVFQTDDLINSYMKQLHIDINDCIDSKNISLLYCDNCFLEYYYPLAPGNKRFYTELGKYDWYYQTDKAEYDFAASFIKADSKVLDIGCGEGNFYKYLNDCEYVGLEPSFNSEKILSDYGKIINSSIVDHSKLYTNYYDYVVLFQVLEHIPNPNQFLEQALMCLKKDGFLIISVPNNSSYINYAINAILNFPPHHIIKWNKSSLSFLKNIFDLSDKLTVELPLDNIHYSNYQSIIGRKILGIILGLKTKGIDTGILNKIANKISIPLSKFIGYLLNKNILQPIGHSIITIYQKQ